MLGLNTVGVYTKDRLCRSPRTDGFNVRSVPRMGRSRHLCPGPTAVLTLKWTWSDGTRGLLSEPEAFVERLCALIWKPRVNTVHYHGVFAPGSAWRAEIVPDGQALLQCWGR